MFESFVRGFQEVVQNTKVAMVSIIAVALGIVVEVLYVFTGKYDFLDLDLFAIKLFEETMLALFLGSLVVKWKKENLFSLLVFSAFYGMTLALGFSIFVLPGFIAFMFLLFTPLLSAKYDSVSTVLTESYKMVFNQQRTIEAFLVAGVVFIVWFIPFIGSILSNFLRIVLVYTLFSILEGSYEKTESNPSSTQSDAR
ncbi:hypothetical protein [Thermotoga sp. KOL6]|uniref:hypothetical protein n=1 Tax=Thermotoga sp. KOL6 TaxID=126741 RepID=UPI000C788904|nr:hypothetical protein [Thermotoga sp. KOL6]PLV59967.1 hypothetical protein AS005_01345 [Thermotoga sp. KOL6]